MRGTQRVSVFMQRLINPQDSTFRDSFFISFHSTSKKAIFLVLQSISRWLELSFSTIILEISKKPYRAGCFSIFFFENKNLILFPLLDSTDASRIHSDNKPRRENQQAGIKRKSGGDGESLFNPNSSLTIEEWSWYESIWDLIDFNLFGNIL